MVIGTATKRYLKKLAKYKESLAAVIPDPPAVKKPRPRIRRTKEQRVAQKQYDHDRYSTRRWLKYYRAKMQQLRSGYYVRSATQ